MMFTATRQKMPACIRYPRGPAEGVPIKDLPTLIEIGKGEVTRPFARPGTRKVALFGLGNLHRFAHQAADLLAAEGFDVAVINPRFIKPLDTGLHEFYGRSADVVVTVEDHVITGGYGSAVLELFNDQKISTPVVRIGWPDRFIEHASTVEDLRGKYGFTLDHIVQQVRAAFETPAALRVAATA
jgi:1-deoxy-D-xylulose-5-phosphate synthase